MDIEIIGEQTSPVGAQQIIVKAADGRYFCVSGVHAMFSGWEVLVFPCDKHGNVTDWTEIVGGRGWSHGDAMDALRQELDN